MYKISTLIIVLICTLANVSKAQDPVYSSFNNNAFYYNPVAPALVDGTEFRFNFREQWPGIPSENHAMNFSIARNFCDIISLGLIASNNIEGESRLTTNNIAISIAASRKHKLKKRLLLQWGVGISTAYGQKRIDFSKIEFDDQYDKLYGKIYPTNFVFPDDFKKNYLDMSLGGFFRGESQKAKNYINSVVIGGAWHHAGVAPNPNFINGSSVEAVPSKLIIHGNYWLIKKHSKNGFSPSFLYEKQSTMQTFNLTMSIKYQMFLINFGYRNTTFATSIKKFDSFILGVGITIPDNIKISYIYDMTVSKLSTGAYGSHEISVAYLINNKCSGRFGGRGNSKTKNIDFKCPSFDYIGESGFFLKPRK